MKHINMFSLSDDLSQQLPVGSRHRVPSVVCVLQPWQPGREDSGIGGGGEGAGRGGSRFQEGQE